MSLKLLRRGGYNEGNGPFSSEGHNSETTFRRRKGQAVSEFNLDFIRTWHEIFHEYNFPGEI